MDTARVKANELVARYRGRLREAEAASYCCDEQRTQTVGAIKKQVKRWETWLADRDALEFVADSDGA